MKFGGTSVGNVEAFRRVAGIVAPYREAQPVVVVSAMTKMTDALLDCVAHAQARRIDEARNTLAQHLARHREVAESCLCEMARAHFSELVETTQAEIHNLLRDLYDRLLPRPILQDAIVAYGEYLSANLLAAVLRESGLNARFVDPRFCLVTDHQHGQAAPLWEETGQYTRAELLPVIDEGAIPVLGGFIGATISGKTTTLGRGGSDYSAAIIGAMLEAREVQIWTDVPGVMTADPRLVPQAQTVPLMSYDEAAELAYFGAKVLHPKTIYPAIELSIPVRVLSTFEPENPGTTISATTAAAPQLLKAIAHKKGVTVLRITSDRMVGTWGFLRSLFEVFDRFRTSIDVIATSEASVSMTLDSDENLSAITRELSRLGEVEVVPQQAVICVVGEGLRATSGLAAKIFAALENINVSLVSHGASSVNLTFVVDEKDLQAAVTQLHERFFAP
jgi:aspartate kinase